MKNRTHLKGSRVLVTGAGSGIGFCIAREVALRGAHPILVDINEESLDQSVEKLKGAGLQGHPYVIDITDNEKVKTMRDELAAQGLTPDVLVNCAGMTLVAHVCATTHEDWSRMVELNLMGPINIIDTFLPGMTARKSGHIVNIGSIDGLIPIPGQAPYCASKFAVTGLTEVLYFDLKHRGVGVTLVCPGAVSTPMAQGMPIRDFPHQIGGDKMMGFLWKLVESLSNTPENIAHHAADAIEYGHFLVIPGFPSRMMWHYRRLFPRVATASGVGVARVFDMIRRVKLRQIQALT